MSLLNILNARGSRTPSFDIWAYSDVHDGNDLGRLGQACTQMDSETWDIGINLGDNMKPDDDGDAVYQRYVAYYNNLSIHKRSHIYELIGNHDRTKADDPAGADFYWKKYADPLGTTPASSGIINANRPYVVIGTHNAYHIEVGNIIIAFLGDDNSGLPPGGESGLGTGSFNFRASGNISRTQWNWFKNIVETNTDKIIIVCAHHGIKDTNIAMGWKEFTQATWRDANIDNSLYYDVNDAIRRGYLAYIDNWEGTIDTNTGDSQATDEIKTWLGSYGQYIDIWLHGHYHRKLDDVWATRNRYAEKYSTRFLNCSTINKQNHNFYPGMLESKSNIISIKGGVCTVKTYVHYDPNGAISQGYYAPEEFSFNLKTQFIK